MYGPGPSPSAYDKLIVFATPSATRANALRATGAALAPPPEDVPWIVTESKERPEKFTSFSASVKNLTVFSATGTSNGIAERTGAPST